MNINREDYLKEIYEAGGLQEPVSNKLIAQKLNVSAASVSEMLAKLQEGGLIEYTAYKGSVLTKEGLAICSNLVRCHRLWEVFLMRHLNYSWREAHEEAHLLEHIATKRMVDRLDIFLNFPTDCPHGEHIPREGEGVFTEPKLEKLANLEINEIAKISRIVEDGDLLDYAERNGVKMGEKICLVTKDEYEGPISFTQGDKTITISHKAAMQIFVECL